jgi:hypothetical protein
MDRDASHLTRPARQGQAYFLSGKARNSIRAVSLEPACERCSLSTQVVRVLAAINMTQVTA